MISSLGQIKTKLEVKHRLDSWNELLWMQINMINSSGYILNEIGNIHWTVCIATSETFFNSDSQSEKYDTVTVTLAEEIKHSWTIKR